MRATQETNPRPVHYSHEVSASKMHDSGRNWHMSATLQGIWTLKVSRVSWCNLQLELFQMMSCMKFASSAADLPGSWKLLRNAFP